MTTWTHNLTELTNDQIDILVAQAADNAIKIGGLEETIRDLEAQLGEANELLASSPPNVDGDKLCRFCGRMAEFGHYQDCQYVTYFNKWYIEPPALYTASPYVPK